MSILAFPLLKIMDEQVKLVSCQPVRKIEYSQLMGSKRDHFLHIHGSQ